MNEINKFIGIFTIPTTILPIGSGIITASIKTKKNKIALRSIIIKTIIPLILGNLYNIKMVGAIRMKVQTRRIMR